MQIFISKNLYEINETKQFDNHKPSSSNRLGWAAAGGGSSCSGSGLPWSTFGVSSISNDWPGESSLSTGSSNSICGSGSSSWSTGGGSSGWYLGLFFSRRTYVV
ncbi:hypothetical protein Hanom_Chr16g01513711 [Helianthus anomalus]